VSEVTGENRRAKALEAIDQLTDLPTLPSIAARVSGLASDPDITIQELKKTIIIDPPLAAKIVKTAGSVHFGRRLPVKTLEEAIVTIGLKNLIIICNSIGFFQSFEKWESHNIDRKDIWKHSLSTGFLAKSLEMRKSGTSSSNVDMFLVGLLHNIGWLVMDHLFPEAVGILLFLAETEDEWDIEFEKEYIGMDHAEVGAIFLKKWGFSDEISEIVRCHHNPDASEKLAFHSSLIEISATLSKHQTPLEIGITQVNDNFPHQLKNTKGDIAIAEMKMRYVKNIEQADTLMNYLVGWL